MSDIKFELYELHGLIIKDGEISEDILHEDGTIEKHCLVYDISWKIDNNQSIDNTK